MMRRYRHIIILSILLLGFGQLKASEPFETEEIAICPDFSHVNTDPCPQEISLLSLSQVDATSADTPPPPPSSRPELSGAIGAPIGGADGLVLIFLLSLYMGYYALKRKSL